MEYRIIHQYSNASANELIIRDVNLHTMRIYGELNYLNEYGGRYGVADVEVLGTNDEKLDIARDFFSTTPFVSYEI